MLFCFSDTFTRVVGVWRWNWGSIVDLCPSDLCHIRESNCRQSDHLVLICFAFLVILSPKCTTAWTLASFTPHMCLTDLSTFDWNSMLVKISRGQGSGLTLGCSAFTALDWIRLLTNMPWTSTPALPIGLRTQPPGSAGLQHGSLRLLSWAAA